MRDNLTMDWQIYVFNSKIPAWLNFMMANYDILPRPAGVGAKVMQRIVRRFGFGVENPKYKEWGNRNISGFYFSSFYQD